jgi:hypothetical protein
VENLANLQGLVGDLRQGVGFVVENIPNAQTGCLCIYKKKYIKP